MTTERLNVNVPTTQMRALQAIAEARSITVTEAVRRAIALLRFVDQEAAAGRSLQMVDPETGTTTAVVIL